MLAPLNMGAFKIINSATPVAPTDVAIKSYVDTVVPSGAIFYFAANAPPTGFLECNGASVLTTTWPNLFAIIGYTFGGSALNFNLPDLRGRFIRGWDHGAGIDVNTPGRVFGSFQGPANITHTHTISQTPHVHGISDPTHTHTQSPHVHGVNDPQHAHFVPGGSLAAGVNLAAGSGFNLTATNSTSLASTGITIQGANAIINAAATGISVVGVNANITGNATNAQGSAEVTVKNLALLPCIKT